MPKTPGPPSMRPTPSRRRRPVSSVLLAVVAIAVAVAALLWWRGSRGEGVESPWRTVQVERGDIRVAISATGTLSAISTVTVGSRISGQVTEVLVDFNSQVTQGQVLARNDPRTYEA